jgi:hypothetical protein
MFSVKTGGVTEQDPVCGYGHYVLSRCLLCQLEKSAVEVQVYCNNLKSYISFHVLGAAWSHQKHNLLVSLYYCG